MLRRGEFLELIIEGFSRGIEMGFRIGLGKRRENREMLGNVRNRYGFR